MNKFPILFLLSGHFLFLFLFLLSADYPNQMARAYNPHHLTMSQSDDDQYQHITTHFQVRQPHHAQEVGRCLGLNVFIMPGQYLQLSTCLLISQMPTMSKRTSIGFVPSANTLTSKALSLVHIILIHSPKHYK